MKSDRLEALTILIDVIENHTPLTHLLNDTHSSFTKALCFGVCRYYYRLQALLSLLVTKRPDSSVRVVLLMGLYQLTYLNKPEYATVQETVALLNKIKKSWAKGLVNAVLRNFCREKDNLLAKLVNNIEFTYNHPVWFIEHIKRDWPDAWQIILKGNDEHPPMSLRVNQRFISREKYQSLLNEQGMEAKPHDYSSCGLLLNSPCDVKHLPDFKKGYVSVQDEAAQLAVGLLNLKPGLRLLDACCAPGGKTCHILESEPALQECIALDVDEHRLKRVNENLARLKLIANVVQGDALVPSTWWDGKLFDRILLDAPCSATGVIRRHPDIKLLRKEKDIETIIELQKNLLESLWPLLKLGGRLVYATCSVMQEENTLQIARFLSKHKEAIYLSSAFSTLNFASGRQENIECVNGWQLFPTLENGDGFFYSVLQKN